MMNENSKGSNKKGAAAVACAVLLASGNDRIRKRWAERPNPLYRSSTSATHPNLDAPRRSPKNSTNRMVSGFRTAYQRLRCLCWFARQVDSPPVRRLLLLLLDPTGFVIWPALQTYPGSTLPQKLARVWVCLFPPPATHPLVGKLSETSSVPRSDDHKTAVLSSHVILRANAAGEPQPRKPRM